MVTTADADIDRKCRLLRQHGMDASDRVRHLATDVVFERYESVGYNYRLTDVQAAIGREQLKRLPHVIEHRRALARRYAGLLAGLPIEVPVEPSWARSNFQSYGVRLPEGCDQRTVMQRMLDDGVATRRGIMCAHREPAYSGRGWKQVGTLQESEAAQDGVVLLPLYHELTEADQDRVVESLRAVCAPASIGAR